MDMLNAMNTFVQIVDSGSLTAAAEAMDKSLPSVVRVLASLEQKLNVRLLHRTTRRIALTDEGRQYLERCRRILSDIEEAELSLTTQQAEPSGNLHISAPVQFGQMHVTPVVTGFIQRYKRVHVNLLLLDRVVNMVEEGMDVAIRIGSLKDSSMIVIPVGEIRRVFCASPKLLKKTGTPKHPEELSSYDCIKFTGLGARKTWEFRDQGKPLSVKVDGPFESNQVRAAIDVTASGAGFGVFLSYQIAPLVKEKKLKILLPDFEPPPLPVNIVYPHVKLISSRVRAFVDCVTPQLRKTLGYRMGGRK